jgi:hypothetical protein
MNWIAANLVWWILLAIGAGAVCFFSKKKSKAWLLSGGCIIVFVVLIVVGGLHLLYSAPGLEDTENERDRDKSKPISKHIDRLRAAWDSEGAANWPVAETLALFCQIAYQPPVDAKDSFQKLGVDSVETIVDGSMVGYVITVADVTVHGRQLRLVLQPGQLHDTHPSRPDPRRLPKSLSPLEATDHQTP